MTDFIARVTEILREHYIWDSLGDDGDPETVRCRCDLKNPSITNEVEDGGWTPFDSYVAHVAELITAAAEEHYRPRVTTAEQWLEEADEADVCPIEACSCQGEYEHE